MTSTETEKIIADLEQFKDNIKPNMVIDYLKDPNVQKQVSNMQKSMSYYKNKTDIQSKRRTYWKDGVQLDDPTKVNNKIPHGWLKLLVDQKVSYLLGKPINFVADDEALTERINEMLGEEFDNTIVKLAKRASIKSKEWLHPFINEEGEFDYVVIPAEQMIPVYVGKKGDELGYGIRHYSSMNEGEECVRVEVYDENTTTFYVYQNDKLFLDPLEEINPQPHFTQYTSTSAKGYGWGKVPLIEFKNNDEEMSDLDMTKAFIDAMDKLKSNTIDSFEEFQELIHVLKGYEGENLGEFMENLRFYKAVKVDSDGGVDTIQAEIPMESMKKILDELREDLFTFGQGVDFSADKFGNSPSGIALRFLYSNLDLKASSMEREFRQAVQQFLWFVCEYLLITNQGQYDYKSIDMTFQRTMITNDLEATQIAAQSKGLISDETIVVNHPWVQDAEQEMERLEKQKEEALKYMLETETLSGGNEDE